MRVIVICGFANGKCRIRRVIGAIDSADVIVLFQYSSGESRQSHRVSMISKTSEASFLYQQIFEIARIPNVDLSIQNNTSFKEINTYT